MQLEVLDATAQAELVRTGQASPAELVDAAIARIERHRELGAVTIPLFDEARAAARGPLPEGPFRGVPILVKDIVATMAGVLYTAGLRPLKEAGYRTPADSYLVESLRRAGFVIVGKTNTSELGILPSAEPAAWGPTRNPYDPTRSTGGSSGGSAAAVAAGLVPIAHANDGGGSIRIPASCCGLVGLKPSRGRTSLGPGHGEINGGLVCEHVVTRSVRDSAALLDLLAGPRPGDPYAAPTPTRRYADEVGAEVGRLRIGFAHRFLDSQGKIGTIHPECDRALAGAAHLLTELGHQVEEAEIEPFLDPEYTPRFLTVWATGVAVDLDHYGSLIGRALRADEVEPLTWSLGQIGRSLTAPAYAAAWSFLDQSARRVAAFFEHHDLWMTPTITAPAPPLGAFAPDPDDPLGPILRAAELAPYTAPINATGQPAISLPLAVDAAGVPIGIQLVAPYGREDLLLRVAAQLEAARPFHHRATRVGAR